ncbi:nicotinamide riboside transporter PnuC [Streptomyces sp. AP-93]|uniref:nicotinamide riboside transporter PnuC n=1 Tax=Streptomyces sp. AP-93 TaxID=2929048 RepID=UPI001FAF619C|nr:nicotinamide riboside transporter PnuC [Streptomyces sp. AP-93]MCJ0874910.1 nicotinamide riboside transporter PnuC [Streptomyces sp. AP-93]
MGWQTSWTEILGFVTGAVCVWLVARQHIANWPIGIANNVFFIVLFAQGGLYADAGLQIVFIALAAYGWWSWTHGGGPGATTAAEWTVLAAAGAVGVRNPLACSSLIRSSGRSRTGPGRREGGCRTGLACQTPRSDPGESPARTRAGELQKGLCLTSAGLYVGLLVPCGARLQWTLSARGIRTALEAAA